MNTQVVNKLNGEQKGEANLEDLQVQDAAEDNVKGGPARYYEYNVVATGEMFSR